MTEEKKLPGLKISETRVGFLRVFKNGFCFNDGWADYPNIKLCVIVVTGQLYYLSFGFGGKIYRYNKVVK